MTIEKITTDSHETVLRIEDRDAGLVAFIAVHSTARGPAAGGLRMRPYGTEDEALRDVLRLSHGMTLKNAAADLPLGGGKAVIVGDPERKTEAQLRAMGRAIDTLEGRYWTAEDMGLSPADLSILRQETRYVAGLDEGGHASGDPSPVTARGVYRAMRVTARHALGSDDLAGRSVAIQGLGHVGWHLAQRLAEAGARLIVADTVPARTKAAAEQFGAQVVAPDQILTTKADILAPCAIGAILNEHSIPALDVTAICGAANNMLATEADADRLAARGILYAPDYVANAGGIINVATEILGRDDADDFVTARLAAIEDTLDTIFRRAKEADQSPEHVAQDLVRERLQTSSS